MPVGKVWVYAEVDTGKVTSATLELLTKAREIASTVEAIYAGPDRPTPLRRRSASTARRSCT